MRTVTTLRHLRKESINFSDFMTKVMSEMADALKPDEQEADHQAQEDTQTSTEDKIKLIWRAFDDYSNNFLSCIYFLYFKLNMCD